MTLADGSIGRPVAGERPAPSSGPRIAFRTFFPETCWNNRSRRVEWRGTPRTRKRMGAGQPIVDPAVVADGASKLFLDGAVVAFHQLSLVVKRNEIMCVVGPSGCGKTTLL